MTNTKICIKCGESKLFEDFHNTIGNKSGKCSSCKKCCAEYQKIHRQLPHVKENNKKYDSLPENRARGAKRKRDLRATKEGKIKSKEANRKYWSNPENRNKLKIKRKTPERLAYANEYKKKYHAENPMAKMAANLRIRTNSFFKGHVKSASAVKDLGCTLEFFREYIAGQFKEGMTYENYGLWHLDHKFPLSRVNFDNAEEVKKAIHYTNIQPLWAVDNLSKSDKIFDINIE